MTSKLLHHSPRNTWNLQRDDLLAITCVHRVWEAGWSRDRPETLDAIIEHGDDVGAAILFVLCHAAQRHMDCSRRHRWTPWIRISNAEIQRRAKRKLHRNTISRSLTKLRSLTFVETQPGQGAIATNQHRVNLQAVNQAIRHFFDCEVTVHSTERPPHSTVHSPHSTVHPPHSTVHIDKDLTNSNKGELREPTHENSSSVDLASSASSASSIGPNFGDSIEMLDSGADAGEEIAGEEIAGEEAVSAIAIPGNEPELWGAGDIHRNAQDRNAQVYRALEKHGLAHLHQGGADNNWDPAFVEFVRKRNEQFAKGCYRRGDALNCLNKAAKFSDFAKLENFWSDFQEQQQQQARSQTFAAVAAHPQAADYLRQHPEKAEELSEMERWLMEDAS